MQLNRIQGPLELEIQSLLILHGSSTGAAQILLKKYSERKLELAELEVIATFCLHAGLPASLLDFLLVQLQLGAKLPWGYMAEALALGQEKWSSHLSQAILDGAEEQLLTSHLARSHALDKFSSLIETERQARRKAHIEKAQTLKRDLFLQIEMMRSQEMEFEEGEAIARLRRLSPKDPQITDLAHEFRSRKALRLLDSKTSRPEDRHLEEAEPALDEESKKEIAPILDSMLNHWQAADMDPAMGVDFAVAQWMWENPEGSLPFLPPDSFSASTVWMRVEVLLRTRRYIELLGELVEMDKAWADKPEATFAISYLRAQALWAMGKRVEAIEIMESILNARPNYRSADSILSVWKRRGL